MVSGECEWLVINRHAGVSRYLVESRCGPKSPSYEEGVDCEAKPKQDRVVVGKADITLCVIPLPHQFHWSPPSPAKGNMALRWNWEDPAFPRGAAKEKRKEK